MLYCNVWAEVAFAVFQKRRCLHKFDYAYFLSVTKLYHVTKFQMLVYSG